MNRRIHWRLTKLFLGLFLVVIFIVLVSFPSMSWDAAVTSLLIVAFGSLLTVILVAGRELEKTKEVDQLITVFHELKKEFE